MDDQQDEDCLSLDTSADEILLEEINCCDTDEDIMAVVDNLENQMTDLLGSSSEHKLRVLKTQLVRVIRLFHNRNRMHGDSNEVDRLRVQCKKLEADLDAVLSESGNLHIEVTFLKGTLQTLQQERAQTQTKLKDFEQKLQIYDGNLSNILRMNIQEITDTEDKLAKTLKLLSNQKESLIKQQKQQSETKNCVICMEVPYCILLKPCGHVCVCEGCSTQISKCPIDRKPIVKKKKVFLS